MKDYFNDILDLIRGNTHRLPILVGVFIVVGGLDLIGLGLVGQFASSFVSPGTATQMGLDKWLGVSLFKSESVSHGIGLLLVGVFLVKTVAGSYSYYIVHSSVGKIEAKIRADLLFSYQMLPYEQWAARNSSEYVNAINVWATQFSRMVLIPLIRLAADGSVALMILALFAYVNWRAFAVLVFLMVGVGVIYDLFIRRKSLIVGRQFHRLSTDVITDVRHAMEGFKEIRILGVEKYFNDRIRVNASDLCENHATIGTLSQVPRYLVEFTIVLFVVVTAYLATVIEEGGGSLVPVFSIFAAGSVRLVPIVSLISGVVTNLRFYREVVRKLAQDYRYAVGMVAAEANRHNRPADERFEKLELQDVWFAYDGTNEWVVKNVSIEILRGESVVLVGPSGSGKTTVVDLILGLLEPKRGAIFVNGRRDDSSLEVLRGKVAYLTQHVFLIDDTVRRNIALGVKDSDIDDRKVLDSLRRAKLLDLLHNLPKGLDEVVGDKGLRLSGGQRQRIALARAFYFEREILVLDEATSAIDESTERAIVDEIMALRGEKTLIVITHRPAVASRCERVYHLSKGMIVQNSSESLGLKH